MSFFSEDELKCKCGCGVYKFDEVFLKVLNSIRTDCDFALPVSSGYRCVNHPIEAKKIASGRPAGAHTTGKAVDFAVYGERAHKLLATAVFHGIKRIGVNQKGAHNQRFIHIDIVEDLPSPTIWSY